MIVCPTFRATGITAYLEAGGTIKNAQAIAAHDIGMRTWGETEHSNIEKAAEFARVVRVLKLAERLGLDLPDSFAGYRELLSDLC